MAKIANQNPNFSGASFRCLATAARHKPANNVRVEVAFQYTTGEEERVRCYANNAYNSMGGTHHSGFRAALTRALNTYGDKEGQFKNVSPIGEE